MSQERVKVIVEVKGGCVLGVYAGTVVNPLIDVVLIDHDVKEIGQYYVEPVTAFDKDGIKEYQNGAAPTAVDLFLVTP